MTSKWMHKEIHIQIHIYKHEYLFLHRLQSFWVVTPFLLAEIFRLFNSVSTLHKKTVYKFPPDYTATHRMRWQSSSSPPWKYCVHFQNHFFINSSRSLLRFRKYWRDNICNLFMLDMHGSESARSITERKLEGERNFTFPRRSQSAFCL
jgi:hypothetical protein